MYLIGLSGKKLSGKDTVANMIIASFPEGEAVRIGFADCLKEEISIRFGVSIEEINKNKDRWRMLMQWYGTEYRRWDDPDYWVKKLYAKILDLKRADKKIKLVIVADVRFKNEANHIVDVGGELWRVKRAQLDGDVHTSETDLDNFENFSIELTNNSSLDELSVQVNEACLVRHINSKTIK